MLSESHVETAPRDSGQAIVEAAIVLPSMILLILGILQLTMIQHARLMTEYAAFWAARAGIVYNADNAAMVRAAELALLPTMTRTDQLNINTYGAAATTALNFEAGQRDRYNIPVVSVTTLSPTKAQIAGNLSSHLLHDELDFDDIRPDAAAANILEIQVSYYYRMQIPFANQMLLTLFFAQVANTSSVWNINSGLDKEHTFLANGIDAASAQAGFSSAGKTLTPLAAQLATAAADKHYFFPVQATYSMRMQSNAYVGNLSE